MVLKKIGSSMTEVLVNGTNHFGPEEQSDDSTYDVDVSASMPSNATIGHVSRSESYSDIDVMQQTMYLGTNSPGDHHSLVEAVSVDYDITMSFSGAGYGTAGIFRNGYVFDDDPDDSNMYDKAYLTSDGTDSCSGTISNFWALSFGAFTFNQIEVDYELTVNLDPVFSDYNASVNINGVSKQ